MSEAILLDRISQSVDNMVLPEDISKGAGTVFSGKDLIAHGGDCRDE